MAFESRSVGRYTVFAPSGDLRGESEVYQSLLAAVRPVARGGGRVAVDFTGVTFLDSRSIGLLVSLLQEAQAYGGEMLLLGVSPRVRKWFELTGLEFIFHILDDEAALAEEERRARKLDVGTVDITTLVEELEKSLGEIDVGEFELLPPEKDPGADTEVIGEIEKLLSQLEETPDGT